MFRNWIQLTFDAALLGVEAQRVIGLRLIRLSAGGPAAQAEASRMVSEKTAALAEAGMTFARGGSAQTVIRRYRSHVRSNKRRLSKRGEGLGVGSKYAQRLTGVFSARRPR
jgi:hypothetical protein